MIKPEEHIGLVHFALNHFARRWNFETSPVSKDDLFSAGLHRLCSCARAFDAAKHVKFSVFALPAIRGAFLDEIRRNDLGGRWKNPIHCIPLDTTYCKEFLHTQPVELHIDLHRALDSLPERQRFVIDSLYLQDRLIREVAKTMNISPARVSQIKIAALGKLRLKLAA